MQRPTDSEIDSEPGFRFQIANVAGIDLQALDSAWSPGGIVVQLGAGAEDAGASGAGFAAQSPGVDQAHGDARARELPRDAGTDDAGADDDDGRMQDTW